MMVKYLLSVNEHILKECSLFQELDPKFVLLLLKRMKPAYYAPNDPVDAATRVAWAQRWFSPQQIRVEANSRRFVQPPRVRLDRN